MNQGIKQGLTLGLLALVLFISLPWIVMIVQSSFVWDELVSIYRYSGNGPKAAFLTYDDTNNHRLFNVVNSLIIDAENKVTPQSARLLSLLSLIAALLVPFSLLKKGKPGVIAAAFCALLLLLSPAALELQLWARGYGLIWLACACGFTGTLGWFRDYKKRWLFLIGFGGIVGTTAVPSAVFIFAPLLLGLWVTDSFSKSTFLTGLFTGLISVALWVPVAKKLIWRMQIAEDEWGKPYENIDAVWQVTDLYFVSVVPNWLQILLVVVALGWVFLPRLDIEPWVRKGVVLALLSGICAHLIALKMETPFWRNLEMANLALMLSIGFCIDGVSRKLPTKVFAPLILVAGALVFLVINPVYQGLRDTYAPKDDFVGTMQLVDAIAPEENVSIVHHFDKPKVEPSFYPALARWSGSKDRYKFVADINDAEFDAGRQIVITPRERWQSGRGIKVWVSQWAMGTAEVWMAAPDKIGIVATNATSWPEGAQRLLKGGPDFVWAPDPKNGSVLTLTLDSTQSLQHFFLSGAMTEKDAPIRKILVGKSEVTPRFIGNLMIVDLDEASADTVEISFDPVENPDIPYGISAIWAK